MKKVLKKRGFLQKVGQMRKRFSSQFMCLKVTKKWEQRKGGSLPEERDAQLFMEGMEMGGWITGLQVIEKKHGNEIRNVCVYTLCPANFIYWICNACKREEWKWMNGYILCIWIIYYMICMMYIRKDRRRKESLTHIQWSIWKAKEIFRFALSPSFDCHESSWKVSKSNRRFERHSHWPPGQWTATSTGCPGSRIGLWNGNKEWPFNCWSDGEDMYQTVVYLMAWMYQQISTGINKYQKRGKKYQLTQPS